MSVGGAKVVWFSVAHGNKCASLLGGDRRFQSPVSPVLQPSQSRRWHPARNTRHSRIRKVAAAAAAACHRAGF